MTLKEELYSQIKPPFLTYEDTGLSRIRQVAQNLHKNKKQPGLYFLK